MWQTLSILAIVMLLFGSYVGMQNRKGLADKKSDREGVERAVDNLKTGIAKSESEFAKAEEARAKAVADNEVQIEVKAKLVGELEDLQSDIATMKESLKVQQDELAKIEADTSGLPDGDELQRKLGEIKSKINNLESEKTDLETQLALLNQDRSKTKESVAAFEKVEENLRQRVSPADLKASIHRSYQNFGFVILNAGYNQNVVPESKLEVVRGDEVVGSLTVTSVEANQSAAQIMGESLADDVVLRAGDRVRAFRPEAELAPDPLPEETEQELDF